MTERRTSLLTLSPALAAYVRRVDAEEVNFRTFVRRVWRGQYRQDVFTIKLKPDGEVVVRGGAEEDRPTEAEAAAIQTELAGVDVPRSVGAATLSDLLPKLQGGKIFEFREGGDGAFLFVQERVERLEGGKYYLPWSFWSDGSWRRMEPDALPPWLPPPDPMLRRVMMHEGAKPAAAVVEMLANGDDHPHREFLAQFAHVGLPGGAHRMGQVDFEAIRRADYLDATYVCDNDNEGRAAAPDVARAYGKPMRMLTFGGRFPEAFDFADPIPLDLFESGKYVGPAPENLIRPSTFAVTWDQVGSKKVARLTDAFRNEWLHAVRQDAFVHRLIRTDRLLRRHEFNDLVAPFAAGVADVAKLVIEAEDMKCDGLVYDPGKPPGIVDGASEKCLNMYTGGIVNPVDGDPSPWLEFVEHLIPVEVDRRVVLRWAATLIARPDVRMLYGLFFASSTHGVGKSTFGDVLAAAIGRHNCSFLSEETICSSQFNDWAQCRLIVVPEIYHRGQPSRAYDRTKALMTELFILINKKHIQPYQIQNFAHFIINSNFMRALRFDDEDRRWFIPTVTEALKPPAHWVALHDWLKLGDGLGIISKWAQDHVDEHGPVSPSEHAPMSERKRRMIRENRSQGCDLAANFLAYCGDAPAAWKDRHCRPNPAPSGWRPALDGHATVVDVDVVDHLIRAVLHQGRHSDTIEKPATIRRLATTEGWHVVDVPIAWGGHRHAYVIASPALAARVARIATREQVREFLTEVSPVQSSGFADWSFDV